jgi:RNA polymerase sigma-70 factor (ECF subfamily)
VTDHPQAAALCSAEHALGRAWREERAAVVAVIARRLGDLALAEDAVQEAFASAATTWPRTASPTGRAPG